MKNRAGKFLKRVGIGFVFLIRPTLIAVTFCVFFNFAANAHASLPPGLWVGDVIVHSVSELAPSRATGSGSNVPVPAEGNLPMRVLLHSDGSGQVHLLKWVTLMAKESQGSDGESIFEEILVTKKSAFFDANVVGRYPDGGERRGFRLYTTAYDWNGSNASSGNQLSMQSNNQEISGTLVLDAQHPSNPFYHRYHNMHQQGRAVTRTVSFNWAPVDSANAPFIGSFNQIQGIYEENIFGLNGVMQNPENPQQTDPHIAMIGSFVLQRISQTSSLNDN